MPAIRTRSRKRRASVPPPPGGEPPPGALGIAPPTEARAEPTPVPDPGGSDSAPGVPVRSRRRRSQALEVRQLKRSERATGPRTWLLRLVRQIWDWTPELIQRVLKMLWGSLMRLARRFLRRQRGGPRRRGPRRAQVAVVR